MTTLAYLGPTELASQAEPERILDRLANSSTVAIDVETNGLDDRTLIGIGAVFSSHESVYCMVLPEPSQYLAKFIRILRDRPVKIFHNGSGFDLDVISWFLDLPTALDLCNGMADTSIMGQVQGVPGVSLARMSQMYSGYKIAEIADILPKGQKMLDLPFGVVANKCLHD